MGDEPKRALYQYLSTIHSLRREEIPTRIGEFVSGMKKALGAASKVIEKLILKKLYEKLGTTLQESPGLDFRDYVEEARNRFDTLAEEGIGTEGTSNYGKSKKAQSSS